MEPTYQNYFTACKLQVLCVNKLKKNAPENKDLRYQVLNMNFYDNLHHEIAILRKSILFKIGVVIK